MALYTYAVGRLGERFYRSDCVWEMAVPTPELVELVEGRRHLAPGRALDIGCGTGVSSVYLAGNGWEVTGVDMVRAALDAAERKASDAGVKLDLVQGDVTRLAQSGVSGEFDLLVDLGCYHMVPLGQRDGYTRSITEAAEPGAVLLMLGMGRFGRLGLNQDEVRGRFPGWTLTRTAEIPGREFWPRFGASRRLRVIARLPIRIWHLELRRLGTAA